MSAERKGELLSAGMRGWCPIQAVGIKPRPRPETLELDVTAADGAGCERMGMGRWMWMVRMEEAGQDILEQTAWNRLLPGARPWRRRRQLGACLVRNGVPSVAMRLLDVAADRRIEAAVCACGITPHARRGRRSVGFRGPTACALPSAKASPIRCAVVARDVVGRSSNVFLSSGRWGFPDRRRLDAVLDSIVGPDRG
jgi:hypothetical protein